MFYIIRVLIYMLYIIRVLYKSRIYIYNSWYAIYIYNSWQIPQNAIYIYNLWQIPPNAIYTYNLRNPQALFTPDKKDEHFIVTLRKFRLRILTVRTCFVTIYITFLLSFSTTASTTKTCTLTHTLCLSTRHYVNDGRFAFLHRIRLYRMA